MEILLALVIGAAFGFALDRVGAANPNRIIGMLNLTDLHLMKTIFTAIGVGSILMFGGQMIGLVDVGNMSVKAAHLGVLLGGAILGAGFAVAGYCPGTGLAALATGRRDALAFAIGGLVGAGVYAAAYAWVESTGVLADIAGGEATLGAAPGAGYPALIEGLPGDVAGLVLGVAMIVIAALLPHKARRGAQAAHA
ncbi:MAG: DUF6691 family protein [Pseudomonadota bacterium]